MLFAWQCLQILDSTVVTLHFGWDVFEKSRRKWIIKVVFSAQFAKWSAIDIANKILFKRIRSIKRGLHWRNFEKISIFYLIITTLIINMLFSFIIFNIFFHDDYLFQNFFWKLESTHEFSSNWFTLTSFYQSLWIVFKNRVCRNINNNKTKI